MKKLFLILFLAIGYLSNAQVPTGLPTLFNGKWYKYTQYLQADSGFFNPQRDTMFIPNRAGCVVFRTADSILYIYTGSRWKGVGSGGGTGIYNAGYGLNLTSGTFKVDSSLISTKLWRQKGVDSLNAVKLNKSDTTTMLLSYLRKADTITLSNRIDLKIDGSGTSGYIPKFTGLRTVENSLLQDDGVGELKYNAISGNASYLNLNGAASNPSGIKYSIGNTTNWQTLSDGLGNFRINSYSGGVFSGNSLFIPNGTTRILMGNDITSDDLVSTLQVAGGVKIKSNGLSIDSGNVKFNTNVLGTNNPTSEYEYVVRNKSTNVLEKVAKAYNTVIVTDIDYTVLQTVDVVFLRDATTTRTLTFPDPILNNGKQIIITFRGTGSKWNFVVTGGSDVLDKSGTVITFIDYNQTFTLISDGTNWIII